MSAGACAGVRGWLKCSLPWCVPSVQPVELFFFQRVFHQLCKQSQAAESAEDAELEEELEVPLVTFQRAMVRLFRVIKDTDKFDAAEYDWNRNGKVGWAEFCSLWKERGVAVKLTFAERVFLTLEDADRSILGKIWSIIIFAAIFVSTGSFILSTVRSMQQGCPDFDSPDYDENCKPKPKEFFSKIDLVCVVLFTAEYILRLVLSAFMRTELVDSEKVLLLSWMISDEVIRVPSKLQRVARWALDWSNLIDLAAIVPWYLSEALRGSSQNESVILKIIRLTRVIRAFRLGRRFEAVIIIASSVRRSVRALYVLVLNLFLGMIIFGALMYFAEQGTWDPDTQAYLRWEDASTQVKSPFDSIPACFWWAIVTATTVGYGDDHTPTTGPGKAVAGLTMVWSLCVLALPIGVIGGNFNQVWQEYDKMKNQEHLLRLKESAMLRRSAAWSDPLYYSRRLVLELWHDSGLLPGQDDLLQSEFLGEVECSLDLRPAEPVRQRCVQVPLAANEEKARRKVRGSLTFEYSWQPATKGRTDDMLLMGRLEVTVQRAHNILNIDWRSGSHYSDPYCVVVAHPHSPDKDGTMLEATERTRTVHNTVSPCWDETVAFDIRIARAGPESGINTQDKDVGRQATIRRGRVARRGSRSHAGDQQRLPESRAEALRQTVPRLWEDVDRLKRTVPLIQEELAGARQDMQLVLAALARRRQRCKGAGLGALAGEAREHLRPAAKGDGQSLS